MIFALDELNIFSLLFDLICGLISFQFFFPTSYKGFPWAYQQVLMNNAINKSDIEQIIKLGLTNQEQWIPGQANE